MDNYLKTIDLFGKDAEIKSYFCTHEERELNENDLTNFPIQPYYIHINDTCNAKCKFCNVHKTPSKKAKFDLDKLRLVTQELYEKDVINWIAITGGEPLLDIELMNGILEVLFDIEPNFLVSFNTNGSLIRNITKIKHLDKLDGIQISRHHYDDEKNNEVFGYKTATVDDLKEISKLLKPHQFKFNCNLVKGYIDNGQDAKKYLEFAATMGATKVAFVSLMPLNDYCCESYVEFSEFGLENDCYITRDLFNRQYCKCRSMIYVSQSGVPVDFYHRQVLEMNCPYSTAFVYTCDNKLLTGFGKDAII